MTFVKKVLSRPLRRQRSLAALIYVYFLSASIAPSRAFVREQSLRQVGVRSSRSVAQNASKSRCTKLRVSSIKEEASVKRPDVWIDGRIEENRVSSLVTIPSLATIPDESLGILALCTVPVLWGTYGPIVRSMYELELPVPGFVFSALYFTVAAIGTTALAVLPKSSKDDESNLGERITELYADTPHLMGGIELGFYVLLANCFHVVGLETVASDRAGFLLQMTTVLVPLVSALFARNLKAVDGTTWLACGLAFAGIVTMNVDPTQDSELSILSSFLGGEGLVICSALMYSLNVIRISDYAGKTDPLKLTAVKATVEAALSWSIVGGMVFLAGGAPPDISTVPNDGLIALAETTGEGIVEFFGAFAARISEGTLSVAFFSKLLGATTWVGLMGTAFVVAAQSYGQRLVKPSDANLIYSLQPIFTAMFASLLLGEQLDSKGMLGGGIILAAVLMVASKNIGDDNSEEVR